MRRKQVLVAISGLTSVQFNAYATHLPLMYRLGRDYRNIDFHLLVIGRMSIDRFRNTAAQTVVQQGFDYLFFIDDDMLVPNNTFELLYKANMDIVAGNVYVRGYPFKIMGYKYKTSENGVGKHLTEITEDEYINADTNGVLRVDAIGTAVSLIKGSILKKVNKPWFLTGPHNTEDIYFCIKSKEMYKQVKIGFHTKLICGHLLEPEVVNINTKDSLKNYYESFMKKEEVITVKEGDSDHGSVYVKETILPGLDINTDD